MSDLKDLQERFVAFRDARNWGQFHTPKDLALCLNVEAGELLELFLWKDGASVDQAHLAEELVDVMNSVLLLAHHFNIDLYQAALQKIEKNDQRYPVAQSWGSSEKAK